MRWSLFLSLHIYLLVLSPVPIASYVSTKLILRKIGSTFPLHSRHQHDNLSLKSSSDSNNERRQTITLTAELTDEKVNQLFAWISRAFSGRNDAYNNLMLALAAIFGNLPENSEPRKMVSNALLTLPTNDTQPVGAVLPRYEREENSLGAMGAAQWTGRWRTRPHALLVLSNYDSFDAWEASLPRGCRRTLKKSSLQNFTVMSEHIRSDLPAPHSSLAHFRCVVEHEVRLLSWGSEGFFDALMEAVSRYVGTTRMVGEIQTYLQDEKVIAFAHEVRKGRVIRGQWFYASDYASKNYVWFHSVRNLVRRAFETDGVDVVDLGPSGSDAFGELKARYGFESIDDWPAVANYLGPFWYPEMNETKKMKGGVRNLLRNFFDESEL